MTALDAQRAGCSKQFVLKTRDRQHHCCCREAGPDGIVEPRGAIKQRVHGHLQRHCAASVLVSVRPAAQCRSVPVNSNYTGFPSCQANSGLRRRAAIA
jgi:hypothetical protein